MKLGVMQPYFFPYLGYFDLINYTDRWIVFDSVQYINRGWINRNRILHPKKDWLYITVPVKHSQKFKINQVKIIKEFNKVPWRQKIISQLDHYKKKAPYFVEVKQLVQKCLDSQEDYIARLNVYILEIICQYLDISFNYDFFSEMNLEIREVNKPGDWALRISESLKAKEYVNPPGGVEIFDRKSFEHSGIKLTIRDLPDFEYSCKEYEFIPYLSIIDVLMWNSPQKIKMYLDSKNT